MNKYTQIGGIRLNSPIFLAILMFLIGGSLPAQERLSNITANNSGPVMTDFLMMMPGGSPKWVIGINFPAGVEDIL